MHLEIQYDHELCNDLLAVTTPEKITPHRCHISSSIAELKDTSARCNRFKECIFRHLDSTREDFKVGGILRILEALGRLSWVGEIVRQKTIQVYSFPSAFKTFRRWLYLLPKGAKAVLRITRTDENREDLPPASPAPPPSLSTTESTLPADYGAFEAINDDSNADPDHCADNPTDTITRTSSTAPLTDAPKRSLQLFPPTRPPKTHHLRRAAADLTMRQFFFISHLAEDDEHTLATMQKHSIYHWSVFKGMTKADLAEAGFNLGPARLIVSGTAAAVAQLENL
ncbi:hypothetical protein PtA15_13A13 [Puccinia triticina]|uniref:Uncharacterized protein n=1 Tax=Puccinia triticina TaxID=208348 RepID=A0ABY7D135_9BASI|nr:uncharacterized protein PtA15_13A13 [Puccinia triticina]WAQ90615.1 hypothetical protein PtA15_13A13 [Puccinia triticina]WAR60769.1 hypothetical protein PtB15_13B13 [Puccinia triticina]